MTAQGVPEAAPGEVATGRIPIGESKDGTIAGLPIAVINGKHEGDTLYIQAASDGDELNGVGVVSRLVPELDPADITGRIVVVAVVNYFGYNQTTHRNPIDDTKINRAYPGDPNGTSSERIAHATYSLASQADIVIDLHQGSTSRMIHETRVRCGRHHDVHEASLELAKIFDTGYILDQQGPDGQLARVLADDGIPAIDPELGACVGWDEESIEIGVQGIQNVLAAYGFTPGTVKPNSHTRISGFDQYNAPTGGLVRFAVDLGDEVDSGDPLFTVTNLFGQSKETIRAQEPGIFWRARRPPHVATGEYVCSIGIDVDEC